jgi:transcription elongation factor Elf1
MSLELESCPFCRSNLIKNHEYLGMKINKYIIECLNCRSQTRTTVWKEPEIQILFSKYVDLE